MKEGSMKGQDGYVGGDAVAYFSAIVTFFRKHSLHPMVRIVVLLRLVSRC